MSCESMRDLEYERQKEEERNKRRKKEEELRKKLEKERYDKAIKTIKEKSRKLGWTATSMGPGKFLVAKPNTKDLMEIQVFKDGKVRVNTPGIISQANHPSADAFLDDLAKTLRGTWKIVTKHFHGATAAAHTHTHEHH